MKKTYFDKYGNVKPNPWDENSENPNLFNAYYYKLRLLNKNFSYKLGHENELEKIHKLIINKWLTNDGIVKTNEYDTSTPGNYLSLDESIGYASICNLFQAHYSLKKLKIWTPQTWFRFYDVIPSLIMYKYNWTRKLQILKIPVAISAVIACLKSHDKTSGKCKAFLQLLDHDMIRAWNFCNWLIDGGFKYAFNFYFGYWEKGNRRVSFEDHPINLEFDIFYKNNQKKVFTNVKKDRIIK